MIHARKDYTERIIDKAGLIPEDEPCVLLRACDSATIPAVNAWIKSATASGVSRLLIESVEVHKLRILDWQEANGVKPADAPLEALS